MSGITPILDTLLHQVLGKRVDIPIAKDQPGPVSAATSSDAVQPSRSDSRLHPQNDPRLLSATRTGGDQSAASSATPSLRVGSPSAQAHLSRAAMEIADLLSRFPSEQSTSIRPAQPLMVQPPSSAEGLSSTLGQSVRESGVFYESHLSRWLGGDYPRAALLREPQAWLGLTFRPVSFEGGMPSGTPANALHAWGWLLARSRGSQQPMPLSPPPLTRPPSERGVGSFAAVRALPPLPVSPFESVSSSSVVTDRQGDDASAMIRGHQLSQHPSDGLQSLVRHQLELIASPGLRWEGEPWPGAFMVLSWSELDEEGRESDADKGRERGEADAWQAQVTIRLPSLGLIDIDFRALRDQPLHVGLNAADTAVRDRLRGGLDALVTRLQALDPAIDVRIGGEAGDG